MPNNNFDKTLLEMALIGYEVELEKINGKIAELRGLSNGRVKRSYTKRSVVEAVAPVRKRRKMSAAARKRIGDAARKRWSELRKAKKRSSEAPF